MTLRTGWPSHKTRLGRRLEPSARRGLAWVTSLVPTWLILHAVGFWGLGIMDVEGMRNTQKYLADRPLLATIFDPNDAPLYQAREVSYLFDLADARILGWLLDRGFVLLMPASGVLGLIAVALIYLYGARKVFQLDSLESSFLLSLFLSCIVTQASTAVFYRSAKIVLSAALLAFLFYVAFLLRTGRPRRTSITHLLGVSSLGFVMSLADRQGFFFLLTTAAVLTLLWLAARVRGSSQAADRLRVAIACGGAAMAVALYGYVVAPSLIARLNGYEIDFTYQQQVSSLDWTLLDKAFQMFRSQVSYLFGGVPFFLVGGVAAIAGAVGLWRRRTQPGAAPGTLLTDDAAILACVIPASLVLLLGTMILYHPPVFSIPDHALWYYPLALHVVLLFSLTLYVAGARGYYVSRARYMFPALLLAMIASNVGHYDGQRRIMTGSGYFQEQYEGTQEILRDDTARAGQVRPARRPWLRVDPVGAIVALPIQQEGFLAEVRAAYATLRHRGRLGGAPGPYWSALYDFLRGPSSPVSDPDELEALIEGLRSVGVGRIAVNESLSRDRPSVRATAEALRASAQVAGVSTSGGSETFNLLEYGERPNKEGLRRISVTSFRVTASSGTESLAGAFNGRGGAFWSSGAPQAGNEWIRIEFDRPRNVGRLTFHGLESERLRLRERAPGLGDRPRGLVIESEAATGVQILTSSNPLGALIRGLLKDPDRLAMEIDVAPNLSRTLILRQTGRSHIDPWSIHRVTIWERS